MLISATTYRRIPLFRYRRGCKIFLENLEFYRRKYGFRLHAYVLMPNHFHLLIDFLPNRALVDFLRDFKSAIGIQIVDWLKADNRKHLLSHLAVSQALRRHKDARYSVWQRDSYLTPLLSQRIIRQKFRYIHENPVRAGLVVVPEDYPYSSARVYAGRGETGKHPQAGAWGLDARSKNLHGRTLRAQRIEPRGSVLVAGGLLAVPFEKV